MSKVLMTLRFTEPAPSLLEVRERFSLQPDDIDSNFGLVEIDPDQHLFTILVEESAAPKIQPSAGWDVKGPYSNPRIEAFGPPIAAPGRLKRDE
jgi:hypothetical protein